MGESTSDSTNMSLAQANRGTVSDWLELASQLRTGVETKDREYRLRTYKDCFLGSDAVMWLLKNTEARTVRHAIHLGNKLIAQGFFHHVVHEHLLENKKLFYRFNTDVMNQRAAKPASPSKYSLLPAFQSIRGCDAPTVMGQGLNAVQSQVLALRQKVDALESFDSEIEAVIRDSLEHSSVERRLLADILSSTRLEQRWTVATCLACLFLVALCLMQSVLQFVVCAALLVAACGFSKATLEKQPWYTPMEALEEIGNKKDYDRLQKTLMLRNLTLRYGDHYEAKNSHFVLKEPDDTSGAPSQHIRDPKLPSLSEWQNFPVLVVPSPNDPSNAGHLNDQVPINDEKAYPFETELFAGEMLVRIKGLAKEESFANHLAKKKRTYEITLKGCFKEPVYMDQALVGHEFSRPMSALPAKWIVEQGSAILRRLVPSVHMDFHADEPYLMALLGSTVQQLQVGEKGTLPDICEPAQEETTLLGGQFAEKRCTSSQRKRILASLKNAQQYKFDPAYEYKFTLYSHLVHFATYQANLGVVSLGLASYLNNQPLQIMGKTTDGRYLFDFEVWHESLIAPEEMD
eukprot:scaffold1643_cov390-Prasinococcus_capsulatus_cf.AAC.12